jgi:hypothetical protein
VPKRLAEATVRRELKRLGWTLINEEKRSGDGIRRWSHFVHDYNPGRGTNPAFHVGVQVFWDHSQPLKLQARNIAKPWIHFQSYNVRLAYMDDFVELMKEAKRLRKLIYLDPDALAED